MSVCWLGGSQSVYGRITIEVRRERVAFGTGRDDAHKGLVVNFAQGASGQQGRIERSAHLLTVHRFHRPGQRPRDTCNRLAVLRMFAVRLFPAA